VDAHIQREETFSPELEAVIAGVRGRIPLGRLDWSKVETLAAAHGVEPLLHEAWQNYGIEIPAPVLEGFASVRRTNAVLGMRGLAQRNAAVRAIVDAGIRVLVLKGAALATEWYHDISLRGFRDIDLWLRAGDTQQARDILQAAGYIEVDGESSHHGSPLYRPDLPCAVEIHHSLTQLAVPCQLPFDEAYSRSIEVGGHDGKIRTLSAEDTLVYLCVHLLAHVDYTRGWRLRQLVDIARHLESFPVDWDVVESRATELGITRAYRATLALAVIATDATVPECRMDLQGALPLLRAPAIDIVNHRLRRDVWSAIITGDLKRAFMMTWNRVRDVNWIESLKPEGARTGLSVVAGRSAQAQTSTVRRRGWGSIVPPVSGARRWAEGRDLVANLLGPQPDGRFSKELPSQRGLEEGSRSHRFGVRPLRMPVALPVATALMLTRRFLRPYVMAVKVTGTSMKPTLVPGHRLFVETMSYRMRAPRRGEVVLVTDPADTQQTLIKRVIGLPGEVIEVRDGIVLINDVPVSEPYLVWRAGPNYGRTRVPTDHYFVLGDNRSTSADSRSWGTLPSTAIQARAFGTYWKPLESGRPSVRRLGKRD
jgi:signal peptidase I